MIIKGSGDETLTIAGGGGNVEVEKMFDKIIELEEAYIRGDIQ